MELPSQSKRELAASDIHVLMTMSCNRLHSFFCDALTLYAWCHPEHKFNPVSILKYMYKIVRELYRCTVLVISDVNCSVKWRDQTLSQIRPCFQVFWMCAYQWHRCTFHFVPLHLWPAAIACFAFCWGLKLMGWMNFLEKMIVQYLNWCTL